MRALGGDDGGAKKKPAATKKSTKPDYNLIGASTSTLGRVPTTNEYDATFKARKRGKKGGKGKKKKTTTTIASPKATPKRRSKRSKSAGGSAAHKRFRMFGKQPDASALAMTGELVASTLSADVISRTPSALFKGLEKQRANNKVYSAAFKKALNATLAKPGATMAAARKKVGEASRAATAAWRLLEP